MSDLIDRSAVLNSIEDWMDDGTGDEFDRGYDFAMRRAMRIIRNAHAVDAVPVVHENDIRSSVITVKDSDGWKDRIILADESTQVCAVYYADDGECASVVRCKDCKHRGGYHCPMYHTETSLDDLDGFDDYNVDRTDNNGFCHRGEKKG